MTDAPRYATLRDYLRVLRSNRIVIIVSVILFGAGAVLLTAGQKSLYRAQSTLSFRDVTTQTSNLVGISVAPTGDAAQRVQINAATITRPAVVAAVARILGHRVPPALLTSGVTAGEQTATGFLVVQVESTNNGLAQALANAYAQAVQGTERSLARSAFVNAASELRRIARQPSIARNPIESATYSDRIGRLEFASQTAQPVTIATNAALPTTPVSPHPIRDGILGVVLGIALGVMVAFARDALDRRPRGTREISEELGWPILGHIREDALGRASFVSVDGRPSAEDADLEGFRILRQNIQFLNVDHPPRSILVTSAKPDEGKSTVAASLACASALSAKRTLLIDCDLRRPSLAQKLGVAPEPGLTDYLLGEAKPAEVMRSVPLGQLPSGNGNSSNQRRGAPAHVAGAALVFIPAGRPTAYPAELLTSQRLRDFLGEVAAAYELIIIDTAPVLSVADTLELLPETEAVLVCVRASKTTSDEVRAVKEAMARLPSRPTGVVVTGVRSGDESEFGYYSYRYHAH